MKGKDKDTSPQQVLACQNLLRGRISSSLPYCME